MYEVNLVKRENFTTSKCERLEPGFLPILLVHECLFILPELLTESMSFAKSSHSDLELVRYAAEKSLRGDE